MFKTKVKQENTIQSYQYHHNLEDMPLLMDAVVLPEAYRRLFEQSWKGRGWEIFPTVFMNHIKSLFPDVIHGVSTPDALVHGRVPFLFAQETFDLSQLQRVLYNWLKHEYGTDNVQHLKREPLEWSTISLVPDDHQDLWNSGVGIRLQEAYVSHRFCQDKVRLLDQSIQFSHLHDGQRHECVSELMEEHRGRNVYRWFYVVQFQAVTEPSNPAKRRINVRLSIRSLIDKDVRKYYNGQPLTVYVQFDNPYMEQDQDVFVPFKLKRKGQGYQWTNKLNDSFNKYPSLDPASILEDPLAYIQGKDGVKAFIKFAKRFGKYQPTVHYGSGLPERKQIFEWVRDHMGLTPVQPIPKLQLDKPGNIRGWNKMRKPHVYDDTPLVLEVWSKSEGFYDDVIRQLDALLDIQHVQGDLYAFEQDNGVVQHLAVRNRLEVTGELEDDPEGETIRITELVDLIHEKGWTCDHPVMALLEIEPFHTMPSSQSKKRDPKQAVREGLRRVNRISQFIHPADPEKPKAFDLRLQNALYDLFSDRGLLRETWTVLEGEMETVDMVGVDILRTEHHQIPAITYVRPNQVPMVKFFRHPTWLRYDEAMLLLPELDKRRHHLSDRNRSLVVDFLKETLDDLPSDKECWVFARAELRFYGFSEITNGNIRLTTDLGDNRFRTVRINHHPHEVPDYNIPKPANPDALTKGKGLFVDPTIPGRYLSVGSRGDQNQTPAGVSKQDMPNKDLKKQRMVEFFIGGELDEKRRDNIAHTAHLLRKSNLQTEIETTLPFPLQLIHKLKKYS